MENPYKSAEIPDEPVAPERYSILQCALTGIAVVLLSGPILGIILGLTDWWMHNSGGLRNAAILATFSVLTGGIGGGVYGLSRPRSDVHNNEQTPLEPTWSRRRAYLTSLLVTCLLYTSPSPRD